MNNNTPFFDIIDSLKAQLLQPSRPSLTDRIPTLNPSSSMCYSRLDSSPIGSCIRSAYLSMMQYPVSNPVGEYVIMTQQAGILWEGWVVDQFKRLGVYVNHSVRVYDPSEFISGEIDILHTNPLADGVLEITEVKQYNGANYGASSSLLGNSKKDPAPKDDNLLQAFRYLLMTKGKIARVNLLYIDRSCSSFQNNKQFIVEAHALPNGEVCPRITYFKHDGTTGTSVDTRISEAAMNEKNSMLKEFLKEEIVPPKDYQWKYDDARIEREYRAGVISKTKHNKYLQDPVNNFIGDWRCQYCPFGRSFKSSTSTCESIG